MRIDSIVLFAPLALILSACNGQPSGVSARNAAPIRTETNPTPPPQNLLDGDVEGVLRKFTEFYRQKKSVRTSCLEQLNSNINGEKFSHESKADIDVERPNHFAIRLDKPPVKRPIDISYEEDIVCDGNQLVTYRSAHKQYSLAPAPASFEELLAGRLMKNLVNGIPKHGPILQLFCSDPYKTLMEEVTKKTYSGRERIDGINAHHLKFEQEKFDWEIWISAEGDPVLLQAKFDMLKFLLETGPEVEQVRRNSEFTITHRYQSGKFEVPAFDAFTFAVPSGWEKYDNWLLRESDTAEVPSPLIGKPAPDVEQKLLDGGHFSLNELNGEKIVLLNFWAAWCNICDRQMPIVVQIAEEYRDRDVVLYCVNQQEQPDEIREFLKRMELDVTVSLDQGDAAEDYEIQGVPTLVVIDKTGIVHNVHVGMTLTIGDKLKADLDEILSGTSATEQPERRAPSRVD